MFADCSATNQDRVAPVEVSQNLMPELPEVQTVVNTLRPRIVGRPIRAVRLFRGDFLSPAGFDLPTHLSGRTVAEVHRRAKRIIVTLENGNRFYLHLGMTGRISLDPAGEPLAGHTHLVLVFDDFEMRFRDPRRFGGVWWLGREDCDRGIGPEPLTMTAKQLHANLSRTKRAIKSALLDQRVVAGLGNIYVDESLHAAGIHPLAPANRLTIDQVKRLNRSIKKVLTRALKHRGSTLRDYADAEGRTGAFQKLHKVYDRAGDPCATCQTPIKRILLAGRSTCFCPRCQPRQPTPRRLH
jgi:formamidopyrimidine-DNA glycosylase